jgi:hypothetical protein
MKRALPDDVGTLVALMAEFYAESRTPRRRQIRAGRSTPVAWYVGQAPFEAVPPSTLVHRPQTL